MSVCRYWYEEEVNGTVVGPFYKQFEFWVIEPDPSKQTRDGKRRIAKHHCETDEQAIVWFREHYPNEYKAGGVEMRVWD